MGAIFYEEHVIILPKRLDLSESFTITFHFYNPVPDTGKFHTLLQDSSGIGGLIVVDTSRNRIGSFSLDGEFIDSGFDLGDPEYNQKWVFFSLSYSIISSSTKLYYNLNCKEYKLMDKDIIKLSTHVQYIGNCRDYDEPFGAICDLRIYRNFYTKTATLEQIKGLI